MLLQIKRLIGLSFLTQVFAFLRTLQIAYYFGIGESVDYYNIGLIVPSFLLGVFGGAIQIGFVPNYKMLKSQGRAGEARIFASKFLLTVSLLSLSFSVISFIFATNLTEFLKATPNASAVVGVLAFTTFFNVVFEFFTLLLNCNSIFLLGPVAQIVGIVVSALSLFFFGAQLDGLILSLMLGLVAQLLPVLLQVLKLKELGSLSSLPNQSDLSKIFFSLLPAIPALIFVNMFNTLMLRSVTALGPGAISTFNYAFKIHSAVCQAVIMPLGAYLLPKIADLRFSAESKKAVAGIKETFLQFLGLSILLSGGIYFLGDFAINLVFYRSRIPASGISEISLIWLLLSFSFLPLAANLLLSKLLQAYEKPILWAGLSLMACTIFYLVQYVSLLPTSVVGVALSVVVAQFGFIPALYFFVKRVVAKN